MKNPISQEENMKYLRNVLPGSNFTESNVKQAKQQKQILTQNKVIPAKIDINSRKATNQSVTYQGIETTPKYSHNNQSSKPIHNNTSDYLSPGSIPGKLLGQFGFPSNDFDETSNDLNTPEIDQTKINTSDYLSPGSIPNELLGQFGFSSNDFDETSNDLNTPEIDQTEINTADYSSPGIIPDELLSQFSLGKDQTINQKH